MNLSQRTFSIIGLLAFMLGSASTADEMDLPPPPGKHLYAFTARSNQVENLQHLRNCVHGEVCTKSHQSWEFGDQSNTLNLQIRLTPSEFSSILYRCPLTKFPFSIQVTDNGADVPLLDLSLQEVNEYYVSRKPEYSYPLGNNNLKKALPLLESMMKKGEYLAFIQKVFELVHFQAFGYSIEFDEKGDFQGALTFHDQKRIVFTSAMFRNGVHVCDAVRVFRHELEHVHQVTLANSCKNQGLESDLEDHDQRELSAHLNDLIYLDDFCSDNSGLNWVKSTLYPRIKGYAASLK